MNFINSLQWSKVHLGSLPNITHRLFKRPGSDPRCTCDHFQSYLIYKSIFFWTNRAKLSMPKHSMVLWLEFNNENDERTKILANTFIPTILVGIREPNDDYPSAPTLHECLPLEFEFSHQDYEKQYIIFRKKTKKRESCLSIIITEDIIEGM